MDLVELVRTLFTLIQPLLNERQTRLFVAALAMALGKGGGAVVTEATGIRSKRIWLGKAELARLSSAGPRENESRRIRRAGAGRKPITETDPTLLTDLQALIDPETRGDPESPLRWTTKSVRHLAVELRKKGHRVGRTKVAELLHHLGFSLQAMRKTLEGCQHPDRNSQFEHINEETKRFQAAGQPVVSVDTKKKELVGAYKNRGEEWQPKGEPAKAPTHDFPDPSVPKAIPYGVYDSTRNEGWVSVGTDHDTAEFAVSTLLSWWRTMGRKAYPEATQLLITADAGGSNGYRRRGWKIELQRFANETGLDVSVSHFPPGTSKWNKIEHRLFSAITQNWRGRPLTNHETVVALIGNTTTATGLKVRARLDNRPYPTGRKISATELRNVRITRHNFHGDWNYTIHPQQV
jgi:Rhodopirellula transposase DDE domain